MGWFPDDISGGRLKRLCILCTAKSRKMYICRHSLILYCCLKPSFQTASNAVLFLNHQNPRLAARMGDVFRADSCIEDISAF